MNQKQKYLYELLTDEDVRIAKNDAGYAIDVCYDYKHYSCDAIIKHYLEIGDHCKYGPSMCPLFACYKLDENMYCRQAIYVDKSVSLYCPILTERLKRRYKLIKRTKFYYKKFNKNKK